MGEHSFYIKIFGDTRNQKLLLVNCLGTLGAREHWVLGNSGCSPFQQAEFDSIVGRVIRIHGTLSLLKNCFKKFKCKNSTCQNSDYASQGDGPLRPKLSGCHQEMEENVLQYMDV